MYLIQLSSKKYKKSSVCFHLFQKNTVYTKYIYTSIMDTNIQFIQWKSWLHTEHDTKLHL